MRFVAWSDPNAIALVGEYGLALLQRVVLLHLFHLLLLRTLPGGLCLLSRCLVL